MPIRIQRQRIKGWRMPAGAIYVGRPTIWGNPFDGSPRGLEAYRDLIMGIVSPHMHELGDVRSWQDRMRPCGHPSEWARSILRGHDLACFCGLDQPCHADVLLEIANR